jgi:copper resistance protein C
VTGHDPIEIIPTVTGTTVAADLTGIIFGEPEIAGDPVSWRVGYRIVSADGHPVTGLINFSVGSGAAPTIGDGDQSNSPAVGADATPAAADVSAWWWLIAGGLLVVAAVAAITLALRRGQRG